MYNIVLYFCASIPQTVSPVTDDNKPRDNNNGGCLFRKEVVFGGEDASNNSANPTQ